MQKQVIEYGGLPVGITIPESGKLRFIAVKFQVIWQDGRRFTNVAELRAAIRDHVRDQRAAAA